MRRPVLAVLALLVLSGVAPAVAQGGKPPAADAAKVEAVLREAGLFGTWAVDCAGPATPANPRVSILIADGGSAIERHELGGEYEINNYRIVAAQRLSKTRVSVGVLFKPGSEREQEQRLILDVEKGTRRTIFNQIVGGKVLVKDGVVTGHNVRTPVLRKCG